MIPVFALSCVLSWQQIRANLGFVYLAILSCTVPYVALAAVNYEFPALIGDALSLIVTRDGRSVGVLRVVDVFARVNEAVSQQIGMFEVG